MRKFGAEQNRFVTNPRNARKTPSNETSSIPVNVAIPPYSFRILNQLGRSINDSIVSSTVSPWTQPTCVGVIPSTGLKRPKMRNLQWHRLVLCKPADIDFTHDSRITFGLNVEAEKGAQIDAAKWAQQQVASRQNVGQNRKLIIRLAHHVSAR